MPLAARRTVIRQVTELEPELAGMVDGAVAEGEITRSDLVREALYEKLGPKPGGRQGETLLKLMSECMRGPATAGDDWLSTPLGFTAIAEMIDLLLHWPRPDGVPAGKLPTPPQGRARHLLRALGDVDAVEVSKTWADGIRQGLGPTVAAALIKRHEDTIHAVVAATLPALTCVATGTVEPVEPDE